MSRPLQGFVKPFSVSRCLTSVETPVQAVPIVSVVASKPRASLRHLRFTPDRSHMKVLEQQIGKLDLAIEAQIKKAGMEEQWELLRSVPGVRQTVRP